MTSADLILQRVRQYMADNQIALKVIAVSTHRSESSISQLVKGQRRMTLQMYLDICDVLGVPPGRFFQQEKGCGSP